MRFDGDVEEGLHARLTAVGACVVEEDVDRTHPVYYSAVEVPNARVGGHVGLEEHHRNT